MSSVEDESELVVLDESDVLEPGVSTPPPIPPARAHVGPPAVPAHARTLLAQDADERAQVLGQRIERAALDQHGEAASLSYELGELCERGLSDDARAMAAYRRALVLDPTFEPARWALWRTLARRSAWGELAHVLETRPPETSRDLAEAITVEHSRVLGLAGRAHDQRTLLTQLLARSPGLGGALLELERACRSALDPKLVRSTREAIIASRELPARSLAVRLVLARELDPAGARALLESAANATGTLGRVIARDRLRLADVQPETEELGAALGKVLVTTTGVARVGVLRRLALATSDPVQALGWLRQAAALAPGDGVLYADVLERVAQTGDAGELEGLLHAWASSESELVRSQLTSEWCARAFAIGPERGWCRTIVAMLARVAPTVLEVAVVECDALAEASRARTQLELADRYIALASTAPAYAVQAIQIWCSLATPATLERAHAALLLISEGITHPVVPELWFQLAETTGSLDIVLARQRAAPTDRLIRLAAQLDHRELVCELALTAARRAPEDHARARWTASLLEEGSERDALIERIARTANQGATRAETARTFAALLRRKDRWPELAELRLAEATASTDLELVRRALREAAWIFEVRTLEIARARDLYRTWATRVPDDEAAWAGLARCASELRDAATDTEARGRVAELAATDEHRYLHAHSLEQAGALTEAVATYRALGASADRMIARTSSLALVELAARIDDRTLRSEAVRALASQSEDDELAAEWAESAGWSYALGTGQLDEAASSFAEAATRGDASVRLLLGTMLVASTSGDASRLATATSDLAGALTSPTAVAGMWLQTAALATATSQSKLAQLALDRAHAAQPQHLDVVVALCEDEVEILATADPFADDDHVLVRAAALLARATSAASRSASYGWAAERIELLEHAGEMSAAYAAIAELLAARPDDWLALQALRRISEGSNVPTHAFACLALARSSRDPANRRALLRASATHLAPGLGLVAYRELATLEPTEEELAGWLTLARGHGEARERVTAISTWLATEPKTPREPSTTVTLLVERGRGWIELGDREAATADLEAVLAHEPRQLEALRLRAQLAAEAGDLDRAVTLWWRYLAVESHDGLRAEVEALLSRALEREAAPGQPASVSHEAPPRAVGATSTWREEPTLTTDVNPFDPTEPVVVKKRTTAAVVRRPEAAVVQALDDLSVVTARFDLSELQEGEREHARQRHSDGEEDYEIEVTGAIKRVGAEEPAASPESTITPVTWIDLMDEHGDEHGDQHGDQHADKAGVPPADRENAPAMGALAMAVQAMDEPFEPAELVTPVVDVALLRERLLAETAHQALPAIAAAMFESPAAAALDPDDSELVVMSFANLSQGLTPARIEQMLVELARELAADPRPERQVLFHTEAGRLAAKLGEYERAHAHFDAALLGEVASPVALRGLRRLAFHARDLAEFSRLIDEEVVSMGEQEGKALGHYRLAVLMAAGERDLARVAAGELLDESPDDFVALVSELALAFGDDRERARIAGVLAATTDDPGLRVALAPVLAPGTEPPGLATPGLAAIERAAVALEPAGVGSALFDFSCQVEGNDPGLAAALAIRSLGWYERSPQRDSEASIAAAQLATRADPRDPFVARIAAMAALAAGAKPLASHALARWARGPISVDRAFAAARAAELEPQKLGRLWSQVLELDRLDDYARSRFADPGHARGAEEPASPATRLSEAFRAEPADAAEALAAWERVLEDDPRNPVAHGFAIRHARRLGSLATELRVLERAQAAETEPYAVITLALRRAAIVKDPVAALAFARTVRPELDDPRRTLVGMLAAAEARDLGAAVEVLEDRARSVTGSEAAGLHVRAAMIALEAGRAAQAVSLLEQAGDGFGPAIEDLLAIACEQSGGVRARARPAGVTYVRLVREADRATRSGDRALAIASYRRALELQPDSAIVRESLLRVALANGDHALVSTIAHEQLRTATQPEQRAESFELIARVATARHDAAASREALRAAYEADRQRLDLAYELEQELAKADELAALIKLRVQMLEALSGDELAIVARDTATLTMRAHRPPRETFALLERARELRGDDYELALQVEFAGRRVAVAEPLAAVQRWLAEHASEPRVRAALATRAAETFAAAGYPAEARTMIGAALGAVPGYATAVALKHALAAISA